MSSAVPLLQILFCLALQFMPAGTKQFTIGYGAEPKYSFTLQDDGTWKGKTENGDNSRDIGVWSANGMVLTAANQGRKFDMDLNKFVTIVPGADQKKLVSIQGVPLKTDSGAGTVTFTQDDGGMLKQPAVITYIVK